MAESRSHARVAAWTVAFAVVVLAVGAGGVFALRDVDVRPNGRAFFVSPTGDDRNDGRSPDRAWRSLDKVGAQQLRPGDEVLLAGGSRFTSPLHLGADDAGDPAAPVIVGSYGTGRAVIAADSAVVVHNTAGVVIRDIDAVGPGHSTTASGISVYSDRAIGPRLSGITIEDVDVAGFSTGIAIGTSGPAGYSDVSIRDSSVHDNIRAGLLTYGPHFDPDVPAYANARVVVSGVRAWDNLGDPDAAVNSGSGIVLGSVDEGRIVGSTAFGNGARSRAREGPIGIWAYDSTRITIERNLSYDNRTEHADGGGFGLDQNTSHSVVQYNLSYGNSGPGVLLFAQSAARRNVDNTVRFNISTDDGRFGGYHGGLSVIGRGAAAVVGARVYHNTVVVRSGAVRPAIMIRGAVQRAVVANNVFDARGDNRAVVGIAVPGGAVTFRENSYSATTDPLVEWNGEDYSSARGGFAKRVKGTRGDIGTVATTQQLTDPKVPALTDARQLPAVNGFEPRPESALSGAGARPETLGIGENGGRDFFGTALRSPPDIGAVQGPPVTSPTRTRAGRDSSPTPAPAG